uniref:Uncharacterized protein n=1 Tax=Ananas comosus var. bracteatus TaxID=296719 RepID=A0A6V7P0B3_ANACO|nr:unnamed protein product [Ananas comosus var. bracteatus]
MERHQNNKEEEEEEIRLSIWDCGSPLYDSYELASLCSLIDRHVVALPSFSESSGAKFAGRSRGEFSESARRRKLMVVTRKEKREEEEKKMSKAQLRAVFKAIVFCRRL